MPPMLMVGLLARDPPLSTGDVPRELAMTPRLLAVLLTLLTLTLIYWMVPRAILGSLV